MPVIFGSETVAEEVYAVLDPIVSYAIYNLSVVPEPAALPAVLHYPEAGNYEGAIGNQTAKERIRYVVRFTCVGPSTDPIRADAEAAWTALNGHTANRDGLWMGFQLTGEWPLTTVLEGGTLYRQLGFYLDVDVT